MDKGITLRKSFLKNTVLLEMLIVIISYYCFLFDLITHAALETWLSNHGNRFAITIKSTPSCNAADDVISAETTQHMPV